MNMKKQLYVVTGLFHLDSSLTSGSPAIDGALLNEEE